MALGWGPRTSVVRLQKKVLELEERLAAAENELKAGGRGLPGAGRAPGVSNQLFTQGWKVHVLVWLSLMVFPRL